MASELNRKSAVEQARLIREKQVTPLEILDAHLEAIARINPQLNAIVTLAADEARTQAEAAGEAVMRGEKLGALHGLPVVIKDVTLTKGMRTTFGSPLYADFIPQEDAEPVARLRRAGAIVLGKTNTPEFAAGANTINEVFGVTRNPWDPTRSPAGSSGGSAVSAATGMSALAHGTDFGCSIRIPASFCGIVGLRTTAGLIPNRPMRLPWDPGQVHGPLARSAEDAALMLDAMTGLDPLWPISVAPTWDSALAAVNATNDAKGLRIAYVSDIAGFGVEQEVDDICRKAALGLAARGASVEHIAFDCSDGFDTYKTLRGEWMVGQQLERIEMLEKFGPNLAGNVKAGLALTVRDTAAAENARERVWMRFRELFSTYDFLITPAAPVPPYKLDQNFPTEINGRKLENYIDWIAPAFLVTLVGFPAGSAPAGKTANNLPVGLQIVGPRFSDPRILGLCKLVQEANPIGWPPIS
ncbi:MAG: amidase [Beijerinckiaceae bacterium]|nr:amidase [Beijerinckiaceae bacterium]